MNLKTFFLDRILYVVVYMLNVFLVILVVELDLLQLGASLQTGNMIYIVVLSLTAIGLLFLVDYLRQRQFLRQVNLALDEGANLEDVLKVQAGATREQKKLKQLLHFNHARYEAQLAGYRNRQEQHHNFITQWAHAMKTPVSVIDLLIQQAQADSPNGQEELLTSVQEENEKIAKGLEMMLHVARLEKFEFDVNVARIDLVQLVRELINSHKKELIRYSIYPKIVSDGEVFVETDRKWMAFVLDQIISNAIKYSKDSGKKLTAVIERSNNTITATIKDEGIGIPRQDLPRIFDPFFTGENGRMGVQSTGMGLYLAKQVCNRLGHRIFADSQQGLGTEITVEFGSHSLIKEALEG